MEKIFYVYAYIREDSSPYYIGKGTGILRNKTDGGEGLSNPSDSTRLKMSEAKRNESPETRLKRSAVAKKRVRPPTSEETKLKIGKANIGKTRSADAKDKMSLAKLGKPGYPRTEETKNKQRKPKEKVECPHCKKIGGIGAMQRWHFSSCKLTGD